MIVHRKMESARIVSRIATIVGSDREGNTKHREIVINVICGGVVCYSVQLFGNYFVQTELNHTTTCFTFSPESHVVFDMNAFKSFVWAVKNRSITKFEFGAFNDTFSIVSQDGMLQFNTSYKSNNQSARLRYYDQLGKDLDDLTECITQYMLASASKEVEEFAQLLSNKK